MRVLMLSIFVIVLSGAILGKPGHAAPKIIHKITPRHFRPLSVDSSDAHLAPQILIVPYFIKPQSTVEGNSRGYENKQIEVSESVLDQRRIVVQSLTDQLRDDTLPNPTEAHVIRLLGDLQATDAVDDLIRIVNFKDNTTYLLTRRAPPRDTAVYALMKMGVSARFGILETIGSEQPAVPFDSSTAPNFARILSYIDGPDFALSRLQKGQTEATNPKIKAQYQMVIDEIVKHNLAGRTSP